MVFHPDERTLTTTSPDGQVFRGTTTLNPAVCCVVWAWSSSSERWLRQTGFVPYSEAGRNMAALLADCPAIRPALTPCCVAW